MAEYKDIPGFQDYRVGDDGSVWSKKRGNWRPRKPQPRGPRNKRKYLAVQLRRDGETFFRKISELVLIAFIGPRPPGLMACHNNGDHEDDRPSNLRWDTHASNMADRDRHGRTARGERIGRGKLTENKVREMKSLANTGVDRAALAKRFCVHVLTISDVLTGKTWKHVQ